MAETAGNVWEGRGQERPLLLGGTAVGTASPPRNVLGTPAPPFLAAEPPHMSIVWTARTHLQDEVRPCGTE